VSDLQALLLGIVQGLTEFFPVSSSGHLAMLQWLMDVDTEGGLVFEVAVHVATLGAILIYYRKRVAQLIAGVLQRDQAALGYAAKLAVGTSPAVMVGLLGKDFIEQQFVNPVLVGLALLVTGCIVFSSRWTAPRASLAEPTWTIALLVGCAQAIAILPGISRSGSTVAAALALGLAPVAAAEFSFMLGIIAISGAAVLLLPEMAETSIAVQTAILIGSAAALVSGVAALGLFVRMLRGGSFHYFAYWAWSVGAAFLIWLWFHG
jgi:undecaprenyl-diphosphatase